MQKLRWAVVVVTGLAFAAPAFAANDTTADAKDTATETKANVKKGARDLKPGEKTAEDRKEDAKDTASATSAKTKKKARAAKRKTKKAAHDATH
jgi:hypothetical protein